MRHGRKISGLGEGHAGSNICKGLIKASGLVLTLQRRIHEKYFTHCTAVDIPG